MATNDVAAEVRDDLGDAWAAYLKLKEERPERFSQASELKIVFDEDQVRAFEKETGRTIGVVFKSPYSMMVVDLVQEPSGRIFAYERIIPTSTGSGVVIVPVHEGNFVLLGQYRHSMRDYQYGFPRGYGENGLSAEENGRKELFEELGATTDDVTLLGQVVANSGIAGDLVPILRCDIASFEVKRDYEGICEVVELSPRELEAWIAQGKVTDAFTLSAWALMGCHA